MVDADHTLEKCTSRELVMNSSDHAMDSRIMDPHEKYSHTHSVDYAKRVFERSATELIGNT